MLLLRRSRMKSRLGDKSNKHGKGVISVTRLSKVIEPKYYSAVMPSKGWQVWVYERSQMNIWLLLGPTDSSQSCSINVVVCLSDSYPQQRSNRKYDVTESICRCHICLMLNTSGSGIWPNCVIDAAELGLTALQLAHGWREKPEFHQRCPGIPFRCSSIPWPVMMVTSCFRKSPYLHRSPPLTMTFQGSVSWKIWPRVQDMRAA